MLKQVASPKRLTATKVAGAVALAILGGAILEPARASADPTASEGRELVFKITVPQAPGKNTKIHYRFQTVDGTARAHEDYRPDSGRPTFFAGQGTKTVSVQTLPDQDNERDETVYLRVYDGKIRATGWRSRLIGQFPLRREMTLTGTIVNVRPPSYEDQKYGSGYSGTRFGE